MMTNEQVEAWQKRGRAEYRRYQAKTFLVVSALAAGSFGILFAWYFWIAPLLVLPR